MTIQVLSDCLLEQFWGLINDALEQRSGRYGQRPKLTDLVSKDRSKKMVKATNDGPAGCCPICGELIVGNTECARCADNEGLRQTPGPHARWINETLACFQFSDEEMAEFGPQVISEIERQLPGSLKAWVLRAILPLLQQRAERFFRFKGVPSEDAYDLSGTFVEKHLQELSKGGPRGNAGTWSVKIRWTTLADYWRRKGRERRWFGEQQEPAELAKVHDPSLDDDALKVFIEELPVQQRDVLDRLREGQKWADIAAYYQRKVADLKEDLQSLKWPEGSVPLRKNRRRRDPNA